MKRALDVLDVADALFDIGKRGLAPRASAVLADRVQCRAG
jgi:hypothetical protein